MKRLLAAVALSLLLGVPAAGAAEAPATATPATATVSMKAFAFMPATVTVAAGGTVTWTYDEEPTDVPGCESPVFQTVPGVNCPGHSATAFDKKPDGSPLFDSGLHRADGFPFSFRFDAPGTYRYYCIVHGGENPNNPLTAMNGEVVVVAAAAAPGQAVQPPAPAPAEVKGAVLAASGWPAPLALAFALAGLAMFTRRLCPR